MLDTADADGEYRYRYTLRFTCVTQILQAPIFLIYDTSGMSAIIFMNADFASENWMQILCLDELKLEEYLRPKVVSDNVGSKFMVIVCVRTLLFCCQTFQMALKATTTALVFGPEKCLHKASSHVFDAHTCRSDWLCQRVTTGFLH